MGEYEKYVQRTMMPYGRVKIVGELPCECVKKIGRKNKKGEYKVEINVGGSPEDLINVWCPEKESFSLECWCGHKMTFKAEKFKKYGKEHLEVTEIHVKKGITIQDIEDSIDNIFAGRVDEEGSWSITDEEVGRMGQTIDLLKRKLFGGE